MTDTTAGGGSGPGTGQKISFPKNAVVGVVTSPREVVQLGETLREMGTEAKIYCGDEAAARIQHEGHPSPEVQDMRVAQKLFGFEAEHSDRYMAEVEAGHFVVAAESKDQEAAERIADAFARNGGHFVNYYTTWTGRQLIP